MAAIPITDADWQTARKTIDDHLDGVVQTIGTTGDPNVIVKDGRFGTDLSRAAEAAVKTVEDCPAAFAGESRFNADSIQTQRRHLENLQAVRTRIASTQAKIITEIRLTAAQLSMHTGFVLDTVLTTAQLPVKPPYAAQLAAAGAPLVSVVDDRNDHLKQTRSSGRQIKLAGSTQEQTIGQLSIENKFLSGAELTPADVLSPAAGSPPTAPTQSAPRRRHPRRRS